VHGAALFADISGFTPLTEALARELGSDGASESLTGHLNRVFHAVIAELHRYGGDVIYFSGDAITCWLDGDDGSRATAAAIRMQEAIAREGRITTPGGLDLRLGLKVAIAVGPARRFVVGDPQIQLIDVLAGALVDYIADTEQLAETGEVVLHETAMAALADRVELGETRTSAEGVPAGVVRRLLERVSEAGPEWLEADELPGELARPWLLPAVYERLSTGGGVFLAELRPAYPMFVNFGGIDYDGDDSASEQLDAFVREAQRVLSGYGGSVLQLTLGDKGAYLYGVFGTPVAHEDDAARACAAALELCTLDRSTAAREIRVGISHGRLLSGTHGHVHRRTFACLGDAVNLAARLMSKAPPDAVYISEAVRQNARGAVVSTALEPLQLKGKSTPLAAYQLTGRSTTSSRRVLRYELPMVGRSEELAAMRAGLDAALAGRGAVLGLSAEAGLGKSRLIGAFVAEARSSGVLVAFGECQSFGTSASYFPWREVWTTLFNLAPDQTAPEQRAALEQTLAEIDPSFVARAPLLDGVLGLSIPDTELTRSFDPELRKTSLENLLADCLRALADREPLVVVLEDCHWLDPLSRDLLDVIARAAVSTRVMLVLAYRPEAALPQGLALGQLAGMQQLELTALDDAQMSAVVGAKIAQLGVGVEVTAALHDLVIRRVQGNPFYAEELLNYIRDQGIDATDERTLRSLDLPGSLHSLILSRIDTLREVHRRTLKVASVLGRVFEAPVLPGVYPDLGALPAVRTQLETLLRVDLVTHERQDDDSYLFKHAATQEVAYGSLPYALRATLHTNVGRYFEQEASAIEQRLDLLAHHYGRGDDEDKKRDYLRRAAVAARAAYANAAAIDYYERLAPLLPDAQRVRTLLDLGEVLELVGELDRARTTATAALELAVELGDRRAQAWCEAGLAEVARKQNRFDEVTERLDRAGQTFEALGDDEGLGRVLHLGGTLAAQRGGLTEARSLYERSLEVRRRLGDRKMMASVLSNLGIVAEYEGDYALSRSFHEQALELRTEGGDRWAIAVSMTNLGMIASLEGRHAEARARFGEAMRLNREVGDSWMVAISHNNLGNAYRGLRDYPAALEHYRDCLRAHRERDDSWALAFLIEDVGRLAALVGDPRLALELVGAADSLREAIGSPRGAALDREIAADVDPVAAALSVDQREAARRRGLAMGRDRAIELALSLAVATPPPA
jgi:class 3 adenylate cyclase/tetratricopeptide (TPR) repeat protein